MAVKCRGSCPHGIIELISMSEFIQHVDPNLPPGEYLRFDPRISPLQEIRRNRLRQKMTLLAMTVGTAVLLGVGSLVLQDAIDMLHL